MIPIQTSPIPSTSYPIVSLTNQQVTQNQPELQQESTYKPNSTDTTQTSAIYKKKPEKLLKPIIPSSICTIPWTPPTPESRTEFVKIHHGQLHIPISKCQHLNTLFTAPQLNALLNRYTKHENYLSRRIVYISIKQEKQTLVDPDLKWKELFLLQVPSLKPIPKPTSKEEHKYTLISRQEQKRLHKILDEDLKKLFSKLETGTITYSEYTILRESARKLKDKGKDAAKALLFPCIRGCNNPENSGLRRFTAPIFLLAANAFLSIIQTSKGVAKVLQPHHQLIIQQIQECNFCSLMELETALSTVYPVLGTSKFKKLLDNALAILEQKTILPLTGPINDVTQHNNKTGISPTSQPVLDIPATSKQQQQTIIIGRATTTQTCTNIRTQPILSTTVHNQYDEPSTSSGSSASWTSYKRKKTTNSVTTTTISEKTKAKISSLIASRIDSARTMAKRLRTDGPSKTTSTITTTNQPIYTPDNEQTAFMFVLDLKPTNR